MTIKEQAVSDAVELLARLEEIDGNKAGAFTLRSVGAVGTMFQAKLAAVVGALNPPKHKFWGAGELDCPREIKAGNGELHTLRCKVCGEDNPRDDRCFAKAASHPLEQQQAVSGDVVERVAEAIGEVERSQCGGYQYTGDNPDLNPWLTDKHRMFARAALTASGVVRWQDIEDAPKDGENVLVWSVCEESGQGWASVGQWHRDHLCSPEDGMLGGAIHWMPLPEPPLTALQEDGRDD